MSSSGYQRDVMPFYGGLVSFFRLPAIEFSDIREGMAVIAGVPIDNGIYGGRLGARLGPRGIREASMFFRAGYELAPEKTRVNLDSEQAIRLKDSPLIGDLGDYNIYPTDLMKTTESVIQGVAEVVTRGGFSVVLGGDHYVTYPSFEGFAKGMAERKEGVKLGHIHMDAHSDFNESNALGGRYHHGTMVRRISENDSIDFKNLAWVGINSPVTIDQFDLKRQHGLKMITAKDVLERGMPEALKEAMDVASDGTDAVYVSVDIDVIDAHQSAGTGSPEFVGVNLSQFFEAMDMLSTFDKLGAFDLCEVSPELDTSGQTVRIAVDGLLRVLHPWLFEAVDLGG